MNFNRQQAPIFGTKNHTSEYGKDNNLLDCDKIEEEELTSRMESSENESEKRFLEADAKLELMRQGKDENSIEDQTAKTSIMPRYFLLNFY